MTKDQLYEQLNYVNATRVSRTKYANIILNDTNLIEPLLEILFSEDKKIAPRASWIFEFVIKANFDLIYPYLDYFIDNLETLKIDSATRPCAKIIEILIDLYYQEKDTSLIQQLTQAHKEKIIDVCFDWMIRDEKIAVKAYSMHALYFLGTEFDWIHAELKTIIEKDYSTQSAGFKARSRHILKRMTS